MLILLKACRIIKEYLGERGIQKSLKNMVWGNTENGQGSNKILIISLEFSNGGEGGSKFWEQKCLRE